MVSMLLDRLMPDQQYDVITHQNTAGLNAVMCATLGGHHNVVRLLLDRLTPDLQYDMVAQQDAQGWNALTYVSWTGHHEISMLLLDRLTPERRVRLLMQENYKQQSALDICITQRTGLAIRLLEYVPKSLLRDCLLRFTSHHEFLAMEAIEAGNDSLLLMILETFRTEIKQDTIENMTHTLSLTLTQREILSRFISHAFAVPNNTANGSRYSLVCYNTSQRCGATAEANYLHKSLITDGFRSILYSWDGFDDLVSGLQSHLRNISNDCSLLFVCFMSHGFRGYLEGKDGSSGQITELLQYLNDYLISATPLVCDHIVYYLRNQ